MVMSMDGEDAAIVRLFGHAKVTPVEDSPLAERLLADQPGYLTNPRQIVEIQVDAAQTSCGYGVPIYEYVDERSKEGRGRKFKESCPTA